MNTGVRIGAMTETMKRILLFDIDGTLLDSSGEGMICTRRALEDVYGRSGPIETYDMAGKTDWQIVTDLMRLAGLDDEQIEAGREDAFAAYARHFEAAAPTFNMQMQPGVPVLLNRLSKEPGFILGLVTGNVREAALHKLQAANLDPALFQFGAFGSEHLDRNILPGLALYRLSQMLGSPVPTESALIIGDTPRDIDCARYAGLKVLSVATGTFPKTVLAEHSPDYLLDDLSDPDEVMEILTQY